MKQSRSPLKSLRLLLLGLPLVFGIAGCSKYALAAASPASAPGILAFAKGKIDVEGGLVKLASNCDGIIKAVYVEEGQRVAKDQILAKIEDRAARLALETAKAEQALAHRTLEPLRIKLAAAEKDAKRSDRLYGSKVTAEADWDHAQDVVAALRAEISVAEAQRDVADSRVRAAEHEVDLRNIRAPVDGWIVKRQARLGDGVSTLNVTPLFVFSPDVPRIVRADLDERYVGKVKPDMRVSIVPEADETKCIEGRVVRIGQVFGPRQFNADPGERVDMRVVECVISTADSTLMIGQRVLVKVLP